MDRIDVDRAAKGTARRASFPLVVVVLCTGGCGAAGWITEAVAGGDKEVAVGAEYRGLDHKSAAVLVSASDTTIYRYPDAVSKVGRMVGARLVTAVAGLSLSDPDQIVKFQRENPHWMVVPPSQLFDRLDVDRLVMIDLTEYSTHEPGNAHVFAGLIVGRVGIVEVESEDPNNFVYARVVSARYPPDGGLGVLEKDAPTVELGMLSRFASRVAGLFHDHTEIQ